jgi:NAD-dependent SIR2 family protein deacetylase
MAQGVAVVKGWNRFISDIVFLGAGASKSEGAPLQGELFEKYFQDVAGTTGLADFEQVVATFFQRCFGIDSREPSTLAKGFPTFEEALGVLELALQRGESFRARSASALNPQLQRVRERLVFLIALVLEKSLTEGGKHHRALVERLSREGTLRRTTFLTSNYDILIDNALIEAFPDFDLDYGVEFTNPEREGDWSRPRKGKAISLHKLHGSLNWLYCPTSGSMTLTPGDKRVAKLVFSPQPCENCEALVIPIIIPPTFFKVMSNFHLQSI